MRAYLFFIAIVGLAGCEVLSYHEQPHHLASNKCSVVAQQREQDAAENGYDEATQKVVFNGTYADCVKWDAEHGGSLP